MALRSGVTLGLQALRTSPPAGPPTSQLGVIVRTLVDTSQRFQVQHEHVKQCWQKLSQSEQRAADMMDKVLTTTRHVEELNEKLTIARASVVKKKQLCEELKQLVDFSRTQLSMSGQASRWSEFHVSEMDRKLADNALRIKEFNTERGHYQMRLRSVLAEVNTVKCRLEDADEGVRYIEAFRDELVEEHEDELKSLKLAIKEAYVTHTSMMAARPDAMSCVVQQLVPDEEEYEQLVAETEDLNVKCEKLKQRLTDQSKEMLHYHSRNHELSLKIKELAAQVKDTREQKMPQPANVNAHAQIWSKRPVTWFEAPSVSMDKVKNFLVRKHGAEAEASVIRYLELKSETEARWHSQMFQKEYVEYERTLEVLAELLERNRKREKPFTCAGQQEKSGTMQTCPDEAGFGNMNSPSPSPSSSDRLSLTISELQLCAQSTGPRHVIVDDIGEVKRTKVTGSQLGLIGRLQAIFKRH